MHMMSWLLTKARHLIKPWKDCLVLRNQIFSIKGFCFSAIFIITYGRSGLDAMSTPITDVDIRISKIALKFSVFGILL